MKNLKKNNSGFTLIELIVVMIIIGILVLLATPRFIRYVRDANATALTVDVKVIKDAALYSNLKAYDEAGKEIGYPVKDATHKLNEVDLLEGTIKENWEKAVLGTLKNSIVDPDKDLGKYNVGFIDPDKLNNHVRNTKYNMKDFIVVLNGTAEGEVFYTGIVKDGDDIPHVGLLTPNLEENSSTVSTD